MKRWLNRGGFLAKLFAPGLRGPLGDTLVNTTQSFWTSVGGFLATASLGFRAVGAFELTGGTNQLNITVGASNALILRTDALATPGDTPTSFAASTLTTATGQVIVAEIWGTAIDSVSVSKGFRIVETWANNAGTLTRRGSATVLHAQGDAGLAAAALTFVAAGAVLTPQATGIAATTIDWDITVQYRIGS